METINRQRICSLVEKREAFICDLNAIFLWGWRLGDWGRLIANLRNPTVAILYSFSLVWDTFVFLGFKSKRVHRKTLKLNTFKEMALEYFDFCGLRLRLTSDNKGLFQMRYVFRSGLVVCMGNLLSDLSPGNYLPNVTAETSRCYFPSCWQNVWRPMAQNCALYVSSKPLGENSCRVVRWL